MKKYLIPIIVGVLFLGSGYVLAQPTSPPPTSNVELPLTQGSTAQTKSGNLTVQGQLTANEVCLNGTCNSDWPAGGAGQIGFQDYQMGTTYNCYASDYRAVEVFTFDNGNTTSATINGRVCEQSFSIGTFSALPGIPLDIQGHGALQTDVKCIQSASNYSYDSKNFEYTEPFALTYRFTEDQIEIKGVCRYYNSSVGTAYGWAYTFPEVRYLF